MAAMVDDLGHTVFEATSALEALAILRRESAIRLVLTDQAMPQMTGAAGHRHNANDLTTGLRLPANANAAPNKESIEGRVVAVI
jgi:CheY-like chemotaxis protein